MLKLAPIVCALTLAGCDLSGERAACSRDGRNMLFVEGSSLGVYTCPGPRGCSVAGGVVSCDLDDVKTGAACPARLNGRGSCSSDGGEGYACLNGKWLVTRCPCGVKADVVVCLTGSDRP